MLFRSDHLFAFEGNGVIKDYPGNYTQYREALGKEGFTGHVVVEDKITVTEPKTTDRRPPTIEKRKLSFKEKSEFDSIEKDIPLLQKEKTLLEEKMNSGTMAFDELQKAAERISIIVQLLDEKEMRWLELSERM